MWWKSAVNRSFFRSLAASRTRSSTCDTLSRFCARRVRCWIAFSLAPVLRSVASAAGRPVLFGDFTATMTESDFSRSVHHRLRLLAFPIRATRRLCLWPDVRSLRFRRVPFRRDVVFDPGGATAPRITVPHMLPSTLMTGSASATLSISRLNLTPQRIAVYASQLPSPTTTQHSLPGGPLRPYPCRSSTGWNAPASPDAP